MPEVKLGLEAVLTIDGGVEITNVKDLTVSLEKPKPMPVPREQRLACHCGNTQRCVHRVHGAQQRR